MEETSLEAFKKLRDLKLLNPREQEVYLTIIQNPNKTDREITVILGKDDPNYSRPRRRDLVLLGIVECSGKRVCSVSHFRAETWHQKSFNLQKKIEELSKKQEKNSKYWEELILKHEKIITHYKEKFWDAKRLEQNQTTITSFK